MAVSYVGCFYLGTFCQYLNLFEQQSYIVVMTSSSCNLSCTDNVFRFMVISLFGFCLLYH